MKIKQAIKVTEKQALIGKSISYSPLVLDVSGDQVLFAASSLSALGLSGREGGVLFILSTFFDENREVNIRARDKQLIARMSSGHHWLTAETASIVFGSVIKTLAVMNFVKKIDKDNYRVADGINFLLGGGDGLEGFSLSVEVEYKRSNKKHKHNFRKIKTIIPSKNIVKFEFFARYSVGATGKISNGVSLATLYEEEAKKKKTRNKEAGSPSRGSLIKHHNKKESKDAR